MKNVKPIKPSEGMEMPMKPQPYYPTVSIDFKAIPEMKNWKVGNDYTVTLKLKQTGMNLSESKHHDYGSAQFEVRGYDIGKSEKPKASSIAKKIADRRNNY
jgi:hypothetical protein